MNEHRPWGPHGEAGSPHEVKPNPTAAGNFPNIGGSGQDDMPAPTGGGGTVISPVTQIFFSIVMLPFVWMFWICLYPLTAAAGIGVAVLATPLFARLVSPEEGQAAVGFAAILGFVVVVAVCRIEYRLAENAGFRNARHVVRLILLGIFAVPWFTAFMGDRETSRAIFVHMRALLAHPFLLVRQMASPVNLAVATGVAVGMHFVLTKATRLRDFWHRRLRWIGLK